MLLENNQLPPGDSYQYSIQAHRMVSRLPSTGMAGPGYLNPFSGLISRDVHQQTHNVLEQAARAAAVNSHYDLTRNAARESSQDALQRLQNHSTAASAFTPTTPPLLRREILTDYNPRCSFKYGEMPSSPVKPSSLGLLPQLPVGLGMPSPIPYSARMIQHSYPPMTFLPPGLSTAYPPFMQMLSAAGSMLPFSYPTKKMFRCSDCRYMTDRKNNLKRHMSTMHGDCDKVLECCDITFKSKASLREHVLLFHQAGYRCRHCGRNFCRKALLKRHLAVHNGQKEYCCEACDYATSHKSNLERHRKVHDRTSPTSELDDQEDYLPEPEELELEQKATKAGNDSFEDITDEDNEEIDVSDVGDSMQYAAHEAHYSVIAHENKINWQSAKNNSALSPQSNKKQLHRTHSDEMAARCQVAMSTKPSHKPDQDLEGPSYVKTNDKTELSQPRVLECSQQPSAKSNYKVCTKCSMMFTTSDELNVHKTQCNTKQDKSLRQAGDLGGNGLKYICKMGSRKRPLRTHEDGNDDDGGHQSVKRRASPTTRAEIPVIHTPEKGSPKYSPEANRLSVITPHLPYVTTSHVDISKTQTSHSSSVMREGYFSHIPSTFIHPGNLVQRLHDINSYEHKQNKQCPLLICKPSEQDAKEPDAFVNREDQSTTIEQVINGNEDRQPTLTHEEIEHFEKVGNVLPLKKRSVISPS